MVMFKIYSLKCNQHGQNLPTCSDVNYKTNRVTTFKAIFGNFRLKIETLKWQKVK